MKTLTGIFVVLMFFSSATVDGQPLLRTHPSGQTTETNNLTKSVQYSRVKIWFDGRDASLLARAGVDLAEGEYRKGVWFVSDFNSAEIRKIKAAGFRTEIVIEDVRAFYKNRAENTARNGQPQLQTVTCGMSAPSYPMPLHFYHGAMGGYFTYDQMLDILDSMALLYPNLITAPQPVDPVQSIEGRDILYVRISDNPNVNETEPEVLYTALHHAREPEGLTQLIWYMWYLLENYATDTTIKALVDNTEMYIVPCVNPDGYIYNELTDPTGGGMWRKNRRDNLDGEFGVDLNRNYGEQWGFDDNGSSPYTFDGTYRGTGPFSEPETEALSNFCNQHEFRLALNYHTYGAHTILPWGYIPLLLTPDSAMFDFYGHAICRYNQYHVGTASQTVGYLVNGNSDDWMYGEQTSKPKILAMTPEVGDQNDGFWPDPSRINFLSESNVYANLTLARLAGRYGRITHQAPRYTDQFINEFHFSFRQLGLDTTGTYTISLTPVSSNVLSVGTPAVISGLSPLQSVSDSVSYTLDPTIQPGDAIRFIASVDNGLFVESDTVSQLYGIPVVVLNDDGSDLSYWDSNTAWDNTQEDFISAPSSITDSPFNIYLPGDSTSLLLQNAVSLAGAIDAHLTFHAKWNIEASYDYLQILASSDGGLTWAPLCGRYTVFGGPSQPQGEPLYDAYQNEWVQEDISLNDYLGMNILLRFCLVSDGFSEYDGFYFDDLKVEMINGSGVGTGPAIQPGFSVSPPVPNPATMEATVRYSGIPEGGELQVFNAFGQKIWKKSFDAPSGKLVIPVKNFSGGIYLMNVLMKDGTCSTVQKMVVNHR